MDNNYNYQYSYAYLLDNINLSKEIYYTNQNQNQSIFIRPENKTNDLENKENTDLDNSINNSSFNWDLNRSFNNKKKNSKPSNFGDRFIPSRNESSMQISSFLLNTQESTQYSGEDNNYSKLIKENLVNRGGISKMANDSFNLQSQAKINNYKNQIETPNTLPESLHMLYDKAIKTQEVKKTTRILPSGPEKILDAPELLNDYYLNLIDWGNNNVLAVSLGQSVYLWNAVNGEIQQLLTTREPNNFITSVAWTAKGNCLAVGLTNSLIQLWDTEKFQPIRNLYGHRLRVSSMSWNNYILSSGSRDSTIINHDVRVAQNVVNKLEGHQQEICGLKWSCDGSQLASGGNDNMLMVWDIGYNSPRFTSNEHKAAVKALAWCPWQKNLLASGGGTADKTMKFWNTDNGSLINSISTDSQVCSLLWNRYDKELVSSHGFSKNQLCLWKYPSMQVLGELHGHTNRVLHLALSPDGSTIVSAAADETLRFWKVFDTPLDERKKSKCKTYMSDLR